MPIPGCRRAADWAHDFLAENSWKRLTEHAHQGQTQPIHSHIIVFPIRTGSSIWSRFALLRIPIACSHVRSIASDVSIMIDNVWLRPEHAAPFGGLLQQLTPRDFLIRLVFRSYVTAMPPLTRENTVIESAFVIDMNAVGRRTQKPILPGE